MTKSRKRMLLSSIAMLLVALVALGSATYAWFSINKTVTADTINVKAVAADGLVINNKKTADWQPSVSFDATTTNLAPVSYAVTVGSAMPTGYIAEEVQTNGGIWRSTDTTKEASEFVTAPALPSAYESGDYQFAKTLNVARYTVDVASSGAALNRAVNASISCTGDTTFVKAALVDPSDSNKIKAFYTDGTAYTAISAISPAVTTADGPAAANATSIMASVPTQAQKKTYHLYVWYEGNDSECLDAAQATSNASFTITFTLADA